METPVAVLWHIGRNTTPYGKNENEKKRKGERIQKKKKKSGESIESIELNVA